MTAIVLPQDMASVCDGGSFGTNALVAWRVLAAFCLCVGLKWFLSNTRIEVWCQRIRSRGSYTIMRIIILNAIVG